MKKPLTLNLTAEGRNIPIARSYAEVAASAIGLGNQESLALALAAEEIFSYLCNLGRQEDELNVKFYDGIYYAKIDFQIRKRDINLGAFNICSSVSLQEDASISDLGLLLASRFVDSFSVDYSDFDTINISVVKERLYPEGTLYPHREMDLSEGFKIKKPDETELKSLVNSMLNILPPHTFPEYFRYPGKVIDMINSGSYNCLVLVDSRSNIGGAIIWDCTSERAYEFFGPYLFVESQQAYISLSMVEAFLAEIAKSQALCVFTRGLSTHLPKDYFELIGTLQKPKGLGDDVYFRQIKEDRGCKVWVCPEIEGYLRRSYQNLALAREMRVSPYAGEHLSKHTLLRTVFDRAEGISTMSPIIYGEDVQDNISRHLRLFKEEDIGNILFEIDLGIPWHLYFIKYLVDNGFKPAFLLPYLGKADVLVLQYIAEK